MHGEANPCARRAQFMFRRNYGIAFVITREVP